MNSYGRLSHVKTDVSKTTAVDDDVLGRTMEAASRGIDRMLNRQVFSQLGTGYYHGDGSRELLLPLGAAGAPEVYGDVLSVTTLKVDQDGDGTYEVTLATQTDWWYSNAWPVGCYSALELNPRGTQLSAFTWGRRTVEAVGRFGYSALSEATGETVQNNPLTDSGTALTVLSTADIDVGEVLVIEAEEAHVTGTPDGTTLTIARGVNGTTAAAHAQGVAISRRRYPADIEEACRAQTVRFFREKRSGGQGAGGSEFGGFSFSTMYPAIRDLLMPHRRHFVA